MALGLFCNFASNQQIHLYNIIAKYEGSWIPVSVVQGCATGQTLCV